MKYQKLRRGDHMHALVLSLSITALVLSFGLFTSTTSRTFAGPGPNPGSETNASKCDTTGSPVINVTEKVKTIDSGQAGNYWAFDDVNRHIQVWKNSDDTYCALVQNEGKFDSQAGQKSPGNTGVLTGSEDGNFEGGYRGKIVGSLRTNPAWNTNGNVGTHDYHCDLGGNCSNYISWLDQYFGPGYKFNYEWWGWTYRYKNHTWVNASTGNSGDIL